MIGGITSKRGMSNAVEILNLETGVWTKGPDYPGIAFGLEKFELRLVSQGHVTSLRVEHGGLAVVTRLSDASRRRSHGVVDLLAHRSDLRRGVGGSSRRRRIARL